MARGSKSSYSNKQVRKAKHIEEGYEARGVSKKKSKERAWRTVNKQDGGAKKTAKKKTASRGAKKASSRPAKKGASRGRSAGASASRTRKTAKKTAAKKTTGRRASSRKSTSKRSKR